MAQTITTKSPHARGQMATGRYLDTGTVAAYTFVLGFKPRYVKVVNHAATGATLEWIEGMAADSAAKYVAAGDKTLVTSNGITVCEAGFVFGLDTDANVTSEQCSFIAFA